MWKEVKSLFKQTRAGVANALNGGTLTPTENNPEQTGNQTKGTVFESKESNLKYQSKKTMRSNRYRFNRYVPQIRVDQTVSKLEEWGDKQRPTRVSMVEREKRGIEQAIENTGISILGNSFLELENSLLAQAEDLEKREQRFKEDLRRFRFISKEIYAVNNAAKYQMIMEELQAHNQRRGATRGAQPTFA